MDKPLCPIHDLGGPLAPRTARASVVKYGVSSPQRPRQIFQCRFELLDGTTGSHRFRQPIPRLKINSPVCDDCGQPVDDWRGDQVLERHWYPALPVAQALAHVADGYSYREAAASLRRQSDRTANPLERRRAATLSLIHALKATGDPSDANLAASMTAAHPYRMQSNEAHSVMWLVETWAPVLYRELAPQEWPSGGIVAVDAVKLNLRGKNKRRSEMAATDGATGSDSEAGDTGDGFVDAPPPVEAVTHELADMLDPDDDEEEGSLQAFANLFLEASRTPGTQGGVPCWQVLAAYGYERSASGEFPRDEAVGKPWLFRAYAQPDSSTWAHFFRQLPGTPAYVLCDMAHEIRVGIELAWPDPAERPQVLTCEYHVLQAIQRRVAGDHALEDAAAHLFRTHGRMVRGEYQEHIPNGQPGSWRRLAPFVEFRHLCREAERWDLERLLATPTWRRIMEQAVQKDGSLRYATGALEATILKLADQHLSWRAGRLTNRQRTDALLMLLQLRALGQAEPVKFLRVLEDWIRHNGKTPPQSRRIDPKANKASLRRALTEQDLADAGLPFGESLRIWRLERRHALDAHKFMDRYHRSREFRAVMNRKRQERRLRNDPENHRHKSWYWENSDQEHRKALVRKRALREREPERYLELRREQARRRYERTRKAKAIMVALSITAEGARELLERADWDVDRAMRIQGGATK